MEKQKNIYWKLFTSTFYISAFTFGGGFVIVPLMRKKFVEELNWIDENEMLDLAAIAQSSPGAIAVNIAILIGYRIGGYLGAFVTILGTVMPPLFILSIVSMGYTAFKNSLVIGALLRAMRACVAAIIIDVTLQMGNGVLKQKSLLYTAIMVLAFIAVYFLHVNVIFIILTCIITGIGLSYYTTKKECE